jgi:hypothetical protein
MPALATEIGLITEALKAEVGAAVPALATEI